MTARRGRACGSARCTRAKVSERPDSVAMAVRISGGTDLPRRTFRSADAFSSAQVGSPARSHRGRVPCRRHETCDVPHIPAFVRDASSRERLGHSDGSGTPWSCRREHDDGVHARAESGWTWGPEPDGPALTVGCGTFAATRGTSNVAGGPTAFRFNEMRCPTFSRQLRLVRSRCSQPFSLAANS